MGMYCIPSEIISPYLQKVVVKNQILKSRDVDPDQLDPNNFGLLDQDPYPRYSF